jgi:transcriptional regulator with XRE-family HTH domain
MTDYRKIIDRIKQVMEDKGLSAAALAQQMGAQRSSFSHLMSGRNKPSLDLLVRLHETFPEYSLDWLVFGTSPTPQHSPKPAPTASSTQKDTPANNKPKEKTITSTLLLYDDGSFQHFSSKS